MNKREIVIELIVFLIAVLFLYAAGSKLADYGLFVRQMNKSPLLVGLSGFVGWAVPVTEILITLMLIIPKYRLAGFYAAFALMVLFTSYIVSILTFSEELPCACGGVLSALGWKNHVWFNAFFIALSFTGVFLLSGIKDHESTRPTWRMWQSIVLSCFGAISIIGILHLRSNTGSNGKADFIRNTQTEVFELKSFEFDREDLYMAGVTSDQIFISSFNDPLNLLILDTALNEIGSVRISLAADSIDLKNARVSVDSATFYVFAGAHPAIFKGSTKDWKAYQVFQHTPYFINAVYVDDNCLFLSAVVEKNGSGIDQTVIGKVQNHPPSVVWYASILKGQSDSIYSSLGFLRYSKEVNRLIYTYRYDGKFTIMDTTLSAVRDYKTIDSILNLASAHEKLNADEHVSESIWREINVFAQVADNLLFIQSASQDKASYSFDDVSVIDVYDIEGGKYQYSYVIPREKDSKIKLFKIMRNRLYAFYDKSLVVYLIKR